MTKSAVAVKEEMEEAEVEKEMEDALAEDVDELDAGLEDIVVDLELPKPFAMEVDAGDRLDLVTSYRKIEVQLRSARNSNQTDAKRKEIEQLRDLIYGQLQRIDLKWKKMGEAELVSLKKLQNDLANYRVKRAEYERKETLKKMAEAEKNRE